MIHNVENSPSIETEKPLLSSDGKTSYDGIKPVPVSIPEDSLFAYQQAAQELDLILNVAKKGEVFRTSDTGTGLIARDGNVGINYMAKRPINSDGTSFDYSKFSARVDELITQAKSQIS